MRAVLIGIGVVVAAALLAVTFWTTSIDLVLARAIEHYGTEALGTKVRVGSVALSAREGRGTIEGLRVAQPAGFGSGDAFTLEEITLDLSAESLTKGGPLVVDEIRVKLPRVYFVVREDGTSNLAAIRDNLSRGGADDARASGQEDGEAEPARLRVRRLDFEGGRIEADLTALGIGTANAPLPPLHENDLGGPAGARPAEMATEIASRFVTHAIATAVSSQIGRRTRQLLDPDSDGVRNLLDTLFPR